MPGKAKDDPNKTRDQETAEKKQALLAYFRAWPVKKAAAEAVNRSSDTIDIWLKDDSKFSEAYNSARAEWALKQSRRLKPENLLANMYEELRATGNGPGRLDASPKLSTGTSRKHEVFGAPRECSQNPERTYCRSLLL